MFYRMVIKPTFKIAHVQKMNVAEMRMLRWMCGHTKEIGLGTNLYGARWE